MGNPRASLHDTEYPPNGADSSDIAESIRQIAEDVALCRAVGERTARHAEHTDQHVDAMRDVLVRLEEKADRAAADRAEFEALTMGEFVRVAAGREAAEARAVVHEARIGALFASQARLAKRVGLVTVVAAASAPAVLELVRWLGG